MSTNHFQVRRFGGSVAVYTGGETRYMTPADADKLADATKKASHDVRCAEFVDSTCGTLELDAPCARHMNRRQAMLGRSMRGGRFGPAHRGRKRA